MKLHKILHEVTLKILLKMTLKIFKKLGWIQRDGACTHLITHERAEGLIGISKFELLKFPKLMGLIYLSTHPKRQDPWGVHALSAYLVLVIHTSDKSENSKHDMEKTNTLVFR